MKKGLVIGGVIIVAVILVSVLAGGQPEGQSDDVSVVTGGEGTVTETFANIFYGGLSTDMKCHLTQAIGDMGELNVDTYVSGSSLRVDYEMTGEFAGPNGDQNNLHIVSDGEYAYVWGDSFVGSVMNGMKYKVDAEDMESGELSENIPISPEMPLDCEPWIPNQSLFEVPDDISFMDLDDTDSIMEAMMQDAGIEVEAEDEPIATGAPGCDICETLTDEMKTSCLESLGC